MSALTLRIIAAVTMLLDHIGYCLHIAPLRYVGRLAFPLYVFLMVNGFRHTRNRLRYALRFGLFALLSQIPYALMCYNQYDHPQWNVMVTLLMGLLVIWLGETLRKHRFGRYFCLLPAMILYAACYFNLIDSDYDGKGILLATIFWFFQGKWLWIGLGSLFAVFNQFLVSAGFALLRGTQILPPTKWAMVQILSLLALPLIYFYNDRPGRLPGNPTVKKILQLGFYFFYPVHMLLLWLLFK